MANEGGLGALMSGLAGGYTAGKQMQRDMANVKTDGKKPDALGVPAQQPQQSATGATLPPVTQPAAVAPGAETQPTGTWNTIAGYLNQQG
jgi:hypothetical protein